MIHPANPKKLLYLGITGGLAFTFVFLTGLFSPRTVEAEENGEPGKTAFLPLIVRDSDNGAPQPDWLVYLNNYRAMAGLPKVSEVPEWGIGGEFHSRYIVKNDVLEHSEDPENPWYTPEGLAAAQASNLAASSQSTASDYYAIDAWMQAPFHALGILDPSLLQVGFGSYREADGGLQMGATLNVINGLGEIPTGVTFPIQWPAQGATVPIAFFWGETPNPLSSCPGYTTPAGLPLVLQIGAGDQTPNVTAHSFKQGSTVLEHCVFTEATYTNPTNSSQTIARSILNSRDAVVLVPREPLTPGKSYTVSLTVNGQTHTWSFTVSSSAQTSSTTQDVTLR